MGVAQLDLSSWEKAPQALLDRKAALSKGGPSGWRPNRLILLNYWRFGYEEFHFVQGRLVLRGANTTGKSTVLVSAITFALDGEKRRERLDTFGGQGRGMAYYLVGHPDAKSDSDFYFEERTGYVALEFEREGNYLTIGVGLYTTRSRPDLSVDSWGFAITDGRRIGIDVELFDEERVPYNARRLEDGLGSGGQVVTRTAEYQALVNRLLFGFDTPEEYQFLLNLLLQLRSPKLNKDTKPSDICEMLTQSLPPLPAELLEQVTQIIEDIDTCIETLEETERRVQAVSEIDDRQAHYFNQVAQRAAVAYLQAHRALTEAAERRSKAQSELERHRAELIAVGQQLAENERQRQVATGELQVLEQHEAFKHQAQIQLLEDDLRKAEENLDRAEQAMHKSEALVQRLVERRNQLLKEWGEQLATLREGAGRMLPLAQDAAWTLAAHQAAAVKEAVSQIALERATDLTAIIPVAAARSAAQERIERIKAVQQALAQAEKAQQAHETAREGLLREEKALQDADRDAQAAANRLDAARETAANAVHAWAESCLTWEPDREALQRCVESIERYPSGEAGPGALVQPLLEAARPAERRLNDAERRLTLVRDQKTQIRTKVAAELAEWEHRSDPEPPRRAGQVEARRLLAARGIEAHPLYAACEFAPGVPDDRAATLEETLQQAGLLDALVIPAGRVDEVAQILGEAGLGDQWLRPMHGAPPPQTLLSVLRPAQDHPGADDVRRALAVTAWVEDPAQVDAVFASQESAFHAAIAPGAWRIGPLRGTADARAEVKALYIGEANRRRHRAEVIARLKEQLESLDAELFDLENDIDAARQTIERFRQEIEQLRELPAWEELRTAAIAVQQAANWLSKRRTAVEAGAAKAEDAYRTLVSARAAYQQSLEPVPEARGRNADGLHNLSSATRQYVGALETLQRDAGHLARLRRDIDRAQTDEQEARKRSAEDTVMVEKSRGTCSELRARRDAVRQHLSKLGVSIEELTARITALKAGLEALSGERSQFDKREGGLLNAIEVGQTALAECEKAVRTAQEKEASSRAVLHESVEAYPTLRTLGERFAAEPNGPAEVAQELLKLRRSAEDRMADAVEKSANEALAALATAFSEHRSALVEYSPEFDNGLVTFRHTGGWVKPYVLRSILQDELVLHRRILRERESELYEEVILRDVAREIRERIAMAQAWRDEVNGLLERQRLSNGETLSIHWRPKPPDRVAGIDPSRVVELLRRDVDTLTDTEVAELVDHFRRRVADVRERYQRNALADKNFADALAEVLDYRDWFQFTLHSKMPKEERRQLTDLLFAARSGAEKSLAMFIPILAAVYARYNAARPTAPRLVGIDEAFAGVDEQNVREMFRFLVDLGFCWIMTSEKLWGVSDTLPACSTYELVKGDGGNVTPIWFVWDGRVLHDALARGSNERPGVTDHARPA